MKLLIGANFKMHKTTAELKDYLDHFIHKYACFANVDLMISPMTVSLGTASDIVKNSCLNLGAQNMHYETSGAYTGETSPATLKELGCKYVILGHSERRQYFREDNNLINKKVLSAIANDIRPILCVGENLEQKDLGITNEVLKIQLLEGLKGVDDLSKVDIAYEPVWAIGTGKSADPDYASNVHDFVRSVIKNDQSRIIYGGSVNEKNASEFIKKSNINGFLVGSASLDYDKFIQIVENTIKN